MFWNPLLPSTTKAYTVKLFLKIWQTQGNILCCNRESNAGIKYVENCNETDHIVRCLIRLFSLWNVMYFLEILSTCAYTEDCVKHSGWSQCPCSYGWWIHRGLFLFGIPRTPCTGQCPGLPKREPCSRYSRELQKEHPVLSSTDSERSLLNKTITIIIG